MATDKFFSIVCAGIVVSGTGLTTTALAGSDVDVGVGVRSGLRFTAAANGVDANTAFDNSNIRPYLSGQLNDVVKFEANLDTFVFTDPTGTVSVNSVQMLDAVGKFEFHEYFNVWFGHFLPPTDRANLSGPYYQNAWNYPGAGLPGPIGFYGFPSQYAGRDDGVAVWGQHGEGQIKYQLGVFNLGPAPAVNTPRYAARMVVNLLDPEPGYYNASTYYGSKDTLAIGGTFQSQADAGAGGDAYSHFNVDLLFEKNLGDAGTPTFEAAFHLANGLYTHYFVVGSYLLPMTVGKGFLQPSVRYQSGTPDGGEAGTGIDAFMNYIIDGHNLRLHTGFSSVTTEGIDAINSLQVGFQLQK